ncbi:hypothetical protein [Empedobacter brevis]|uniref:hypothetical protein n=1 Tax=Empedobacter brevis TaxID=247 RepID=UPI0023F02BE5|nr:hypothetical protein [Empedobacter brevis]
MGKGPYVDLTSKKDYPTNGKDQVVWRSKLGYYSGGRTLDVTELTDDAVYAGHIIVRDKTTEVCRALEVTGDTFNDIKVNDEILGLTVTSVPKNKAFVSMVTIGIAAENALPFKMTDELKAKVQAALPGLQFHK